MPHLLKLLLLAIGLPIMTLAKSESITWDAAEKTLQKYCSECHSDVLPDADLDLTSVTLRTDLEADPHKWTRVVQALRTHYMPHPDGRDLPTEQRHALIQKIRAELIQQVANEPRSSAPLRRLNRIEFSNTLNDLLYVDGDWGATLPADDAGYGFDNIAAALSISPLLLERYFEVAARAALIAVPQQIESSEWSLAASNFTGGATYGATRVIYAEGSKHATRHTLFFPGRGQYELQLQLSAQQAGPDNARAELRFDGKRIGNMEVTASKGDSPQRITQTVMVDTAGEHLVEIRLAKDFYRKTEHGKEDRNLIFHGLHIQGPVQTPEDLTSPFLDRHFNSLPERLSQAELRAGIQRFASRAYRRPATNEEIAALWDIFTTNSNNQSTNQVHDVRSGLYAVIDAVLTSPNFLFRLEQADPTTDYALASWLSYFLWGSMPDDRLFQLARRNTLHSSLNTEIQRMLDDPKSIALADNFAGQWWRLRDLDIHRPDTSVYKIQRQKLLASMKEETRRFFLHVLRNNRPLLDFLVADYTFVDERLAKHYGIEGIKGSEFRKVSLADSTRRGVWSQAGILTITSYPNHTSPVLRGQWILENIMGLSPPPPPDNIPSLPNTNGKPKASDLRASLALHRDNPDCASCHDIMDPFGLALEHYDGVGALRGLAERKQLGTETLFDGTQIANPAELANYFAQTRSDDFIHNLAKKVSIYATGRGLDWRDEAALLRITEYTRSHGDRFTALIHAVTNEFAPLAKPASLTTLTPQSATPLAP